MILKHDMCIRCSHKFEDKQKILSMGVGNSMITHSYLWLCCYFLYVFLVYFFILTHLFHSYSCLTFFSKLTFLSRTRATAPFSAQQSQATHSLSHLFFLCSQGPALLKISPTPSFSALWKQFLIRSPELQHWDCKSYSYGNKLEWEIHPGFKNLCSLLTLNDVFSLEIGKSQPY